MSGPDEPLLDLDTRRRVYRYVESNPGMHLRGIQRGMEMPLGTVEYHLHQMEKNGLLVTRDDGRFKAFFVKEGIDRRDKNILYYVRQENPRRIMIHLLENPGSSHSQIAAALPVGPSTVSFHLSKLVKAGLVSQTREGRSKRFVVDDPERTAGVLVRYRKSFLDDLVDRFASSWLNLTPVEPTDEESPENESEGEKRPPDETPPREETEFQVESDAVPIQGDSPASEEPATQDEPTTKDEPKTQDEPTKQDEPGTQKEPTGPDEPATQEQQIDRPREIESTAEKESASSRCEAHGQASARREPSSKVQGWTDGVMGPLRRLGLFGQGDPRARRL